MNDLRKENDSLGGVNVPSDKLWGTAAVLKADDIQRPAARAPMAANRA